MCGELKISPYGRNDNMNGLPRYQLTRSRNNRTPVSGRFLDVFPVSAGRWLDVRRIDSKQPNCLYEGLDNEAKQQTLTQLIWEKVDLTYVANRIIVQNLVTPPSSQPG